MKEIFGMPSNLPPLAAQELWLHMKTLERTNINIERLFRSTRHDRNAGAPDSVHAWRKHGAIASLHASFLTLCRLGLLEVVPLVGGGMKHIAKRDPHSAWKALLSLQRPPKVMLSTSYRTGGIKVCMAVKLIAKYHPAKGVALLRCVFGSFARKPSAESRVQSCGICQLVHTGHHVASVVCRGCFRRVLAEDRRFTWLAHSPPS
eukprot:2319083-Amphidinium_carterae.1